MKKILLILILVSNSILAQNQTIEIGTFNIEWFPCKDDGEMMKKYGIDLRYPPTGNATDVEALFSVLKELDVELLGVQEIVDPKLLGEMAKKYLGEEYEMVYSTAGGSQKVGFLYDSSVLELVGEPQTYASLLLRPDSRLRPAYRAYFKSKPSGFDFHAIVVHLKASPRGWDQREQQLTKLEEILKTLPEESKDSDIILLGDMNNVTKAGAGEFKPMMERLGFYWATSELQGKPTNYWQPDWKVNKIKASTIDHIFVSADAKIEFVENSTKTSGGCSEGTEFYEGENIPQFFNNVSDHCPVYGSFVFEQDDD